MINFDNIIGDKFELIGKVILHPTNSLIFSKTGTGKSNLVMNIIYQNNIYDFIYIFTNNLDPKWKWLKDNFQKKVNIYLDDLNFDKILKNKKHKILCIFDDLVYSNKKIELLFTKSRKLNTSCIFIAHSMFKNISRLLRSNCQYIIFSKLDKRQLSSLYNDQDFGDISLQEFKKINSELKQYDFIILDKIGKHKIRKNFDEIYLK